VIPTLYFWFIGVPEDRPGGPWWVRDFRSSDERARFFSAMFPFVHAYCETMGHEVWDPQNIKPPQGARIVYPHGSTPR
jgi:hypothetical protein